MVDFLSQCQDKEGGYGGGPGQVPHIAPTYASVNALIICGTERAYQSINRETLYRFLIRMKHTASNNNRGAFTMHHDGEVDIRYVN